MRTAELVWDLQKASARARTGTGVVGVVAVASQTVCAAIAFLVAGGTWMFYNRWQDPSFATGFESLDAAGNPPYWFILSLFACVFLVPALAGLASQAAVLGASGRERRLAALRLIGLSSRDVTRMTMIETAMQTVAGLVLGAAVSVLLLPVFAHLSFQNRRVHIEEIVLPWWGYLMVAAALLALALGASFVGIKRVRVSPLGVAKREMPAALKRWRLIVFVAVLVVAIAVIKNFSMNASLGIIIGSLGVLAVPIFMLNLVMPLVLQVIARAAALLPGTAHFVACRRISGDARSAWRRSSSTTFFGVIAGYLTISPLANDGLTAVFREEPDTGLIFTDITTGALITMAFGFTLAAFSVFLGQASAVYETADLSRSLQLIGVKRFFQAKVALTEILQPIVIVSLSGFLLGAGLGWMMMALAADQMNLASRFLIALSLLGAGWAVTLLAVALVEPLRGRVLAHAGRKND